MTKLSAEEQCQIAIVKYLRGIERTLKVLTFFHCPNQLGRTTIIRQIMAALGMRAGVSDLIIFAKEGRVMLLELKMEGKYQSPAQKAWEATVTPLGFKYYLVKMRDKADAVRQVEAILKENGAING